MVDDGIFDDDNDDDDDDEKVPENHLIIIIIIIIIYCYHHFDTAIYCLFIISSEWRCNMWKGAAHDSKVSCSLIACQPLLQCLSKKMILLKPRGVSAGRRKCWALDSQVQRGFISKRLS